MATERATWWSGARVMGLGIGWLRRADMGTIYRANNNGGVRRTFRLFDDCVRQPKGAAETGKAGPAARRQPLSFRVLAGPISKPPHPQSAGGQKLTAPATGVAGSGD